MGNLTYDGNVRLFLVDTIADIDAPTVAEIGAGTEITTSVPKDGWSVQNAPSKVDTGNLSTLYESEVMGTYKLNCELTILLDDADSTILDLFAVHGDAAYIVELPYKGTGAVAASDVSHVFPIESGKATPNPTAANERQTAMVPIAVTAEPSLNGAVAA